MSYSLVYMSSGGLWSIMIYLVNLGRSVTAVRSIVQCWRSYRTYLRNHIREYRSVDWWLSRGTVMSFFSLYYNCISRNEGEIKYGGSFELTATVYLLLILILMFKNIKVSRDKAEHKTTICSGGVAIPTQTPAFLTLVNRVLNQFNNLNVNYILGFFLLSPEFYSKL